jgi:GNAT superfamily N-acetyltransferase
MVAMKIRKYNPDDYARVWQLFYAGLMENWPTAYKQIWTSGTPQPLIFQASILLVLYCMIDSIVLFLLVELLVQGIVLFLCFFGFWNFAQQHRQSDMRDRELSHWTQRGDNTAGYFVAEAEEAIIGTGAYEIRDSVLEVFRLAVDKNARQKGIASTLVAKIEEIAREHGCHTLLAVTSAPQEPAMRFYKHNSWEEEKREPVRYFFVLGINLVFFQKSV